MTFATPNHPKSLTARVAALLAGTFMVAAACTGSGTDISATDTESSSTTGSTATESTTTVPPSPQTTPPGSQASPTPPDSLPGELIEFGPAEGDALAVVGVAYDDTLNVRLAPGTDFETIGELEPDEMAVTATGHNRLLADSFWVEIDRNGELGWVNERFVGYPGVSLDLESSLPAADATALELAQQVAEASASIDPPSVITVAAEPGADIVVMDVMGLGDDAAKGYRLTVTTAPTSRGREVIAVDQQIICSRGLTPDGLCV